MGPDSGGGGTRSGSSGWIAWGVSDDVAEAERLPWLDRLQLGSFRFLAGAATVALLLIAVRNIWLGGARPWVDLANSLFFLAVFCLVSRRPGWLRPLSWLGLASFFVNAVEGLVAQADRVIVPTHMLLPLLVLYSALLGDIWMSAVATTGVLALYAWAGFGRGPLDVDDVKILMNLGCTTVLAGLGAFGVWLHHRRFAESHRLQATSLRRELDARLRLHAILSHDIRNPLAALMGAAEILKASGGGDPESVDMIEKMANRIWSVIDSAREMGGGFDVVLAAVPVERLWAELEDMFEERLEGKGQRLVRGEGGDLMVWSHRDILCNSVLSNIMGNAIKFSPRGAAIELAASMEGERVRLEIRDHGAGISADVLAGGSAGGCYDSHPGTEGETGHAYGLRIAALCLSRLQGRLEIRNRPGGGASVAVVIPAAASLPKERAPAKFG
ncbi:MAG: HAMP domain-containing histidine kinase [Verrucomicrobiae bacterium]|nr:HAMP domain-containing histidine kinase [Verrucomicrobiae bacterium]